VLPGPLGAIPTAVLQRAAEVLSPVLSGSQIVSTSVAYALDFNVDIPHAAYPFSAPNKKTALFENLLAFSPSQQYQVIYELCERVSSDPSASSDQKSATSSIKWRLLTRHQDLANLATTNKAEVPPVVTHAKHWLADYAAASKPFGDALLKHSHGMFPRNMLDDLRLSLESLVKDLLGNSKRPA
jgi:hypothetical protein